MEQDNSHPQPGDLIEIFRTGYQHWALYVGDGFVIHVTGVGSHAVSGSSSPMSITRAKVKKQLLKEVVGNNKWRVNNKYDRSRTPRPVEEIIRRAERWIDREVPYDVLESNCEHFVTELRYGVRASDQGRKLALHSLMAGSGILGALAVAAPAGTVVGAVLGGVLFAVKERFRGTSRR